LRRTGAVAGSRCSRSIPADLRLLADDHRLGQCFTPPKLSERMASWTFDDMLDRLNGRPSITSGEPVCWAVGMIFALVKEVTQAGHDPQNRAIYRKFPEGRYISTSDALAQTKDEAYEALTRNYS
jgi:hypothetical protein